MTQPDDHLAALRAKLTPKQARFAEEYARTGNGGEAVRAAGYSATRDQVVWQQVGQNLSLPHVVAYLNALTAPARQQRIADAQELAERLTAIVRGEVEATHVTRHGIETGPPSHADINRAAETLAKIRGYLAPIKVDVTLEIRDGAQAWLGAVLTLIQAQFALSDEQIEALLPQLPPLQLGRQTVRVIDAE